jgi:hypothetical protein
VAIVCALTRPRSPLLPQSVAAFDPPATSRKHPQTFRDTESPRGTVVQRATLAKRSRRSLVHALRMGAQDDKAIRRDSARV